MGSIAAAVMTSGGSILARGSTPVATPGTPMASPVASPVASPDAMMPGPVSIALEDMRFNPNEITIPADTDVTFTFQNRGFLAHDFAIDNPRIFSGVLRSGKSASMVLNLPAGTYTFYCTQIAHRSAGMVGTLIVK